MIQDWFSDDAGCGEGGGGGAGRAAASGADTAAGRRTAGETEGKR